MEIAVHAVVMPTGEEIPYVVADGEPHVDVTGLLVKLNWLHLGRTLIGGAIRFFGKGRRIVGFVRVSWVAEICGPEDRDLLIELRRRLLAVSEAVERSPDGDATVHFAQDQQV
jgi:hypothetical protein